MTIKNESKIAATPVAFNNDNDHKNPQGNKSTVKEGRRRIQEVSLSPGASCWDPAAKQLVFNIPYADYWHALVGTDLKSENSEFVYRILNEERVGRFPTGDPIFRVTIGATDNHVMAVIQREMKSLSDRYVIYGLTPNEHEGVPYKNSRTGQKQFDMYPIVEIVQSILGKDYTIQSPGDGGEILFKASNGNIRATLLCCTLCLLFGAFPFKFTFYRPNQFPRQIALFRDQRSQTVAVAPGTSPLLSICVAYALDRLSRPVL